MCQPKDVAVQREIINHPDILSLKNDADLTRGRVLTLREILFAIPTSDTMCISQNLLTNAA